MFSLRTSSDEVNLVGYDGELDYFYYAGEPVPAQIISLMVKQREASPKLIRSVNLTKLVDSDLVAGGIIKAKGFIKSPPEADGIFNYRYLGEIKKMSGFHVLKCTFTTGGSSIYVSIVVIKSYTENLPHFDHNWCVNWQKFTFLENVIDISLGDRFSGEVNFDSKSAKLSLKGKNHNGGIIDQEINLAECIIIGSTGKRGK